MKEYKGRSPPTRSTERSEVRVVKIGVMLRIIQCPSSYLQTEKFRALSLYIGCGIDRRFRENVRLYHIRENIWGSIMSYLGECEGYSENFEPFLYSEQAVGLWRRSFSLILHIEFYTGSIQESDLQGGCHPVVSLMQHSQRRDGVIEDAILVGEPYQVPGSRRVYLYSG